MAGEEKEPEKKATFISTLFTSALTLLAAVVIFLVLNSFHPPERVKQYNGLVSPADGRITVTRDGDLRIDAILFNDFDGNEHSISLQDNPGHKINFFVFTEREGKRKFDMLSTLSRDSIDPGTLPATPHNVKIKVADLNGLGAVKLFIITERSFRNTKPIREGSSQDLLMFDARIGWHGLEGFVAAKNVGTEFTGAPGEIDKPGEGPVAALIAVRFQGGVPVGRSQIILIRRKGIVHPDDIWFDANTPSFFSRPFEKGKPNSSRLALLTPVKGGKHKLIVCNHNYSQRFNISSLFDDPVAFEHWGSDKDDFNILYVREETGDMKLYKVNVGVEEAVRITDDADIDAVEE